MMDSGFGFSSFETSSSTTYYVTFQGTRYLGFEREKAERT